MMRNRFTPHESTPRGRSPATVHRSDATGAGAPCGTPTRAQEMESAQPTPTARSTRSTCPPTLPRKRTPPPGQPGALGTAYGIGRLRLAQAIKALVTANNGTDDGNDGIHVESQRHVAALLKSLQRLCAARIAKGYGGDPMLLAAALSHGLPVEATLQRWHSQALIAEALSEDRDDPHVRRQQTLLLQDRKIGADVSVGAAEHGAMFALLLATGESGRDTRVSHPWSSLLRAKKSTLFRSQSTRYVLADDIWDDTIDPSLRKLTMRIDRGRRPCVHEMHRISALGHGNQVLKRQLSPEELATVRAGLRKNCLSSRLAAISRRSFTRKARETARVYEMYGQGHAGGAFWAEDIVTPHDDGIHLKALGPVLMDVILECKPQPEADLELEMEPETEPEVDRDTRPELERGTAWVAWEVVPANVFCDDIEAAQPGIWQGDDASGLVLPRVQADRGPSFDCSISMIDGVRTIWDMLPDGVVTADEEMVEPKSVSVQESRRRRKRLTRRLARHITDYRVTSKIPLAAAYLRLRTAQTPYIDEMALAKRISAAASTIFRSCDHSATAASVVRRWLVQSLDAQLEDFVASMVAAHQELMHCQPTSRSRRTVKAAYSSPGGPSLQLLDADTVAQASALGMRLVRRLHARNAEDSNSAALQPLLETMNDFIHKQQSSMEALQKLCSDCVPNPLSVPSTTDYCKMLEEQLKLRNRTDVCKSASTDPDELFIVGKRSEGCEDAVSLSPGVISIHHGQFGVQLGSRIWDRYARDHCIDSDGKMICGKQAGNPHLLFSEMPRLHAHEAAGDSFHCNARGNGFTARAIFADVEPGAVDRVRMSRQSRLFHPSNLLNGCEDAVGCTEARYGRRNLKDAIIERVRVQVEQCDSLSNTSGFMQYYSVCGSAGGGLAAAIAEDLKTHYAKAPVFGINLHPSRQIHNGPVEPYNAVLSLSWLHEFEDAQVCLDNEALWDYHSQWVDQPATRGGANYSDVNRIVADYAANITSPARFDGPLTMSLSEMLTNAVPYPAIHYLLPAMASTRDHIGASGGDTRSTRQLSTLQLITRMWEPSSFLVKTEPRSAIHYASITAHVGNGQSPSVPHTLDAVRYVETSSPLMYTQPRRWYHRKYDSRAIAERFKHSKLGICAAQRAEGDSDTSLASSAMLLNCGAAGEILQRRIDAFDRLYSKRSHFHWFVAWNNGGDGEFSCAREDLAALLRDYQWEWSKNLDMWHAGNRFAIADE